MMEILYPVMGVALNVKLKLAISEQQYLWHLPTPVLNYEETENAYLYLDEMMGTRSVGTDAAPYEQLRVGLHALVERQPKETHDLRIEETEKT